ncbi:hypothetical protein ACFSNO_31015 [Streptomyces cirratus]
MYLAYIFSTDLTSVTLTVQQGVTDLMQKIKQRRPRLTTSRGKRSDSTAPSRPPWPKSGSTDRRWGLGNVPRRMKRQAWRLGATRSMTFLRRTTAAGSAGSREPPPACGCRGHCLASCKRGGRRR